jgi:hypothetical protein
MLDSCESLFAMSSQFRGRHFFYDSLGNSHSWHPHKDLTDSKICHDGASMGVILGSHPPPQGTGKPSKCHWRRKYTVIPESSMCGMGLQNSGCGQFDLLPRLSFLSRGKSLAEAKNSN